MAKTIGIDLGTTNSCVAVLEGGEPTVLENAEGGRTTPSVVAFTDSGERLVGTVAKRQAVMNPENTIFSIKRFMGRKEAEVKEEETIVPYKVVAGPNGDVRVEVRGKQYSPPEISAMILQKLKADAEAKLGETVDSARDHRPRLLQRRPAPGDQGRRQDRRPRGQADHQRADRRGARLRPRQGGGRPDDPRLRPRRRHLRRLRARDRRRRVRGQGDRRRQPPRRRQLGQGDRRVDGRRVQARPGHRPLATTSARCSASTRPPRRRRSSSRPPRRRRSACRSSPPIDERAQAPRDEAHPGEAQRAHLRPARARRRARSSRRSPTPAARHRPRRPGRRHDPHARGPGEGQGADRQGPAQGRQPGRGRGDRRRDPGRACWPATSRTCCCSTSPR